ncbi:hypothetical protein EV424DRAFT_1341555 [Suillus variegatus]|nr:hypothetical protein EV424DRAFT_1356398 [Suillus variegatus]KAG1834281.1 hypothetical protein EV424DRAFT_1341555 [Suillus variegatus]
MLRVSYPIIDHRERFIAPRSLAFNLTADKLYCCFEDAIEIFDIQQPGEGGRPPTTPSKNSKDGLKRQDVKFTTRIDFDPISESGIISSVAFSSCDHYAIGSLTPSQAMDNIALRSESNQAAIMPIGGADSHSGVTQASEVQPNKSAHSDLRRHTSVPVKVFRTSPGPRKTLIDPKIEFDIDYAGRWLSVGDLHGCVSMFDLEDSDELGSEQSPVISPQSIAPKTTFNAHGGKYMKHSRSSLLSGSRHFDEDMKEGDPNSSDGDSSEPRSRILIARI